MTLVKSGGAKISEGFSIRQAADDTDLVAVMCGGETGVKVRRVVIYWMKGRVLLKMLKPSSSLFLSNTVVRIAQ